jgi:hypothetical protein
MEYFFSDLFFIQYLTCFAFSAICSWLPIEVSYTAEMECCLVCCRDMGATNGNLFSLVGLKPATEPFSFRTIQDPGVLPIPDDTLLRLGEGVAGSRTTGVPPDKNKQLMQLVQQKKQPHCEIRITASSSQHSLRCEDSLILQENRVVLNFLETSPHY